MVLKPDQERVRALLTETISLLCKNGLEYKSDFVIEALIGITIDKDDVFLISIKETIENEAKKALEEAERLEREKAEQLDQENAHKSPSRCRRSPKRRRRSRSNASDSDINNEEPSEKRPTVERGDGDSSFNIKQEIEDEEDEDLVFVKSEGDINMKQSHSFADMQSTSYMNDSSQYSDTGGGGAFSDTSFADNSASFGDGWSGAYPPGGAGPPGGPPPGFMPGTDEQSQQMRRVDDKMCRLCHRTFSRADSLRRHLKWHMGVYRFKCHKCNKGFMDSTKLNYHYSKNPACAKSADSSSSSATVSYDKDSVQAKRLPTLNNLAHGPDSNQLTSLSTMRSVNVAPIFRTPTSNTATFVSNIDQVPVRATGTRPNTNTSSHFDQNAATHLSYNTQPIISSSLPPNIASSATSSASSITIQNTMSLAWAPSETSDDSLAKTAASVSNPEDIYVDLASD